MCRDRETTPLRTGACVVLLIVNLIGQMILLPIQFGLVRTSQMPVILRPHVPLFAIQPGFLRFQISRFSGSELAAFHAVGDALLLVILALLDFRLKKELLIAQRPGPPRAPKTILH